MHDLSLKWSQGVVQDQPYFHVLYTAHGYICYGCYFP